jgi:hypothetical protein
MDPILGNPCSRKKDGGSFSMPPAQASRITATWVLKKEKPDSSVPLSLFLKQ